MLQRVLSWRQCLHAITDESVQYALQAHILKVMRLMGCEDGYESSMRRLPHIDVCNQIQYASELDAASVQRLKMCSEEASRP